MSWTTGAGDTPGIWTGVSVYGTGDSAVIAGGDANNGYLWYLNNIQPVCLLENCDVLVEGDTKEHIYKNITKITKEDRVIGFFTRKPVKILEVIKRVHKIKDLESTNVPYVIKKSTFGENIPDKNIHLSGHHRLIIRNGDGTFTGVQAFKLGLSKLEVDTETVTYFHIRLEITQEGLIVNNLPVESCQD